jgi:hypothetical protein
MKGTKTMAKQSLASRKEVVESNPGTGLPVGFDGGPIAVVTPAYQPTPYVLFVSPKGQTFAKVAQQIPDLQDGDAILIRGDSYTRLNPFRFYLVQAFQHFSIVDSQGSITETTFDLETAKQDKTRRWSEHVETVIIVIMPDGSLVPATCTFKTTKTNAAHKAIEEMRAASEVVTWAERSPEHKASSFAPWPYARFVVTVTLKRGTSKGGFAFVAANAFTRPTGLADWQALAEAFKDDKFKKLCEAVYDRYQDRVADIKSGA